MYLTASHFAPTVTGIRAMDTTFVDREQPRLLQELSDFLSIPSVSTLPAHADDTRRALASVHAHRP